MDKYLKTFGLLAFVLVQSFFTYRLYQEVVYLENKNDAIKLQNEPIARLEERNKDLEAQNNALNEDLAKIVNEVSCYSVDDKSLMDKAINLNSNGAMIFQMKDSSIYRSQLNISKESKYGMYIVNSHNNFFRDLDLNFDSTLEAKTGVIIK